jgi:hypothetical protein
MWHIWEMCIQSFGGEMQYTVYMVTIYHPDKGVAMGSPISGTMAEIFLQNIENKHIKQLLGSKNITFYTRYVDNIFIIYDTKRTTADNIQTYLDHIYKILKLTPTYEDNAR